MQQKSLLFRIATFFFLQTLLVFNLQAQSLAGLPDRNFNPTDTGKGCNMGPQAEWIQVNPTSGGYLFNIANFYDRSQGITTYPFYHEQESKFLRSRVRINSGVFSDTNGNSQFARGASVWNWTNAMNFTDQNGSWFCIYSKMQAGLSGIDSFHITRQFARFRPNSSSNPPATPKLPGLNIGFLKSKKGIFTINSNQFIFWMTAGPDTSAPDNQTSIYPLDSSSRLTGTAQLLPQFRTLKGFFRSVTEQFLIGVSTVDGTTKIFKSNATGVFEEMVFSTQLPQIVTDQLDVFSVLPDGKILLAGNLVTQSGTGGRVVRLLPNGIKDASYTEQSLSGKTGLYWGLSSAGLIQAAWFEAIGDSSFAVRKSFGTNGSPGPELRSKLQFRLKPDEILTYHPKLDEFIFQTEFAWSIPYINSFLGGIPDTLLGPKMLFRISAGGDLSLFSRKMGVAPLSANSWYYNYGTFDPTTNKIFLATATAQYNRRFSPGYSIINLDGSLAPVYNGFSKADDYFTYNALQLGSANLGYFGGKILVYPNRGYWTPLFAYDTNCRRYNVDGSRDFSFDGYPFFSRMIQHRKNTFCLSYARPNSNLMEGLSPTFREGHLIQVLKCDSIGNKTGIIGTYKMGVWATQPSFTSSLLGVDDEDHVLLYNHSIKDSLTPGTSDSSAFILVVNANKTIQVPNKYLSNIQCLEFRFDGLNRIQLTGNFNEKDSLVSMKNSIQRIVIDTLGNLIPIPGVNNPLQFSLADGYQERNTVLQLEAIQSDGKIIASINKDFGTNQGAIIRYFSDGRYDPSFLPLKLRMVEVHSIFIAGDRLYVTGLSWVNNFSSLQSQSRIGSDVRNGIYSFKLNSSPQPVGFAVGKIEQVAAPGSGCNPTEPRRPVAMRTLKVNNGNQLAFTDNNGGFAIALPPGTHTLSQTVGNNALQRQVCPAPPNLSREVTLASVGSVSAGNNFINQTYNCPRLGMYMFTPRFRLCSRGNIVVQYYNDGMATEPNARIRINLPSVMKVESATKPFTVLPDSSLVFEIGSLAPGHKGQFIINDTISCPSTPDSNQRACFSARMEPFSLCSQVTPSQINWDGAWLDARAKYNPATQLVRIVVENRGANMADSVSMALSSNHAILMSGKIRLAAGDSLVFNAPVAVIGSISLALEQPQNCPLGERGQLFHSGYNTATSYLSFTNGWFEAQTTTACPPFRYSYDPNEKQVYPSGDIQPGTNLEYTIHFENYGNDTAYAVSVVDSLPKGLDFNTFTFRGSSHPCTIQFEGDSVNPIITFHFRGIKLTGKKQDSIRSKGQFTFTINSLNSIQPGHELRNRAHIYFDRNEAIITNTVVNRVPIVTSLSSTVRSDKPGWVLYPNPTNGSFTLNAGIASAHLPVRIFTLQGLKVFESELDASGSLSTGGLKSGVYFVSINGLKTKMLWIK